MFISVHMQIVVRNLFLGMGGVEKSTDVRGYVHTPIQIKMHKIFTSPAVLLLFHVGPVKPPWNTKGCDQSPTVASCEPLVLKCKVGK